MTIVTDDKQVIVLARFTTQIGLLFWLVIPAVMSATGYQPSRSAQAFKARFEQAFSSGLLSEALPLFYWRGVPGRHSAVIETLIKRDLSNTLLRTAWLPLAGEQPRTTPNNMQSNVPVVARFAAQFMTESGHRYFSVHDVGVIGDVYVIALSEPVPRAAARELIRPTVMPDFPHQTADYHLRLPQIALFDSRER